MIENYRKRIVEDLQMLDISWSLSWWEKYSLTSSDDHRREGGSAGFGGYHPDPEKHSEPTGGKR